MQLYKSQDLKIYNTLTGNKEVFKPIHEGNIGMYVCGPTVYSNVHLGNVRTFMSFDVIYRYLKHLEFNVRYVRNITDAGHLTDDGDVANDRFVKQSRLEKLEPMEIVQKYTVDFHKVLDNFNFLPPTIEPTATGHIIEQIELIEKLIEVGVAYESKGSVYFDVLAYNKNGLNYGELSNRNIDELFANTRDLDGQSEKKNPQDFALWKNASPAHIMRWNSPWGAGFPGWHLECTAISTKYLGETFDIHGGGMDLLFPHHECEIAQSQAATKKEPVRYWMHNNMITINGQKMGKSLGNFITLNEFFSGSHQLLSQAFHPMTVRFFILQAHYRGTLDFSNEALIAAEKGLKRLLSAIELVKSLNPSSVSSVNVADIRNNCVEAMNDDFNTPIVIANLFEAVKTIHLVNDGKETLTAPDIKEFTKTVHEFTFDILGLKSAGNSNTTTDNLPEQLMEIILSIRKEAKEKKDYATSDKIRDALKSANIEIKDGKDGVTWNKT